jgi:hypothetical protein
MKDIQNKKLVSRNCHRLSSLCHRKGKLEVFFFHVELTRMCQLMTFGELGNIADTTGTGSVRVVASRVEICYGCPASFYNAMWMAASYTKERSVVGQQTEDYW